MRNLTWIVLLGVLGLGGCPDGGPPVEPDVVVRPGGVVELGTGALAFEALQQEQELGLIAGPQGGFHFIVNARIREMAPGDPDEPVSTPSTRFAVYREDGEQIDLRAPAYRIAYEDTADGWFTLPSGRILQIQNAAVPAIYGTRVRIEVTVVDEQGLLATDERWVVVFDHCVRYPEDCQFG